jgi:hypothetical protein
MSNDHDYSKLPKWAQQEIESLQRSEAELLAEYRIALGTVDSNTKLVDYVRGDTNIPDRSTVKFVMPDGGEIEVHRCKDDENAIEVRGVPRKRNGSLVVRPRVTNVVVIGTEAY